MPQTPVTFFKSFRYPAILFLYLCVFCFFLPPASAQIINNQPGQKLTNPLLKHIKFKELRPFKQKIEELLQEEMAAGRCQEAAVYFRSLTNGIWIGINEKKKFAPASILKVPTMMAYFKEAETNPGLLTLNIPFSFSTKPGAQHIQAAPIKNLKKEYSIGELIRIMIEKSDNDTLLFLQRYAPMSAAVTKTFSQLGLPEINYKPGDTIGLKTCCSLFRILYNASYLNIEMSEKALHYLSQSEYKKGLVSGVPPNITVAHKFGERTFKETGNKELHDIGIIYYPKNPYILGVMTKGDNFDNLTTVIADISRLVYNEVDSQYQNQMADFELAE